MTLVPVFNFAVKPSSASLMEKASFRKNRTAEEWPAQLWSASGGL